MRAQSFGLVLATAAAAAMLLVPSDIARSQSGRAGLVGVTWSNAGVISSGRSFRVPGFIGYTAGISPPGFNGVFFSTSGVVPTPGAPLVEIARRTDPQIRAGYRPEDNEPEQDTAPPDRGLVAFADGDYRTAYNEYSVRARFRPDDLEALRLKALAAAGLGNFVEAGGILIDVYEREPGLRHAKLPARQVIGASALQRIVLSGSRRAEAANNRETWFAVAVLSHAAGGQVVAESMYERSVQAPRAPVE